MAIVRCGNNCRGVIFKLILLIDTLSNSYEIALRRIPQNLIDD